MTGLMVCIGLILSNYFWQAVGDREWAKAWELSVFQVVAVAVYAICLAT